MTRYEYKVLQIPHRDGTYSSTIVIHSEDLEDICNRMAADGWEPFGDDRGSILLFRREIGEDETLRALQDIRDMLRSLTKPSAVDEATLRGEA